MGRGKKLYIINISGNLFIFYNTVALDRMRLCNPHDVYTSLGIIENTCTVQKETGRRTEDTC